MNVVKGDELICFERPTPVNHGYGNLQEYYFTVGKTYTVLDIHCGAICNVISVDLKDDRGVIINVWTRFFIKKTLFDFLSKSVARFK